MTTSQRAAELLVVGTLDRSAWPQLEDPEFAEEVKLRLGGVGLELVAAAGKWLAVSRTADHDVSDGFDPTFKLHTVEMAMVAALYLHLRWLPAQQAGIAEHAEPWVEVEDLLQVFQGYKRQYLDMVLGHLRKSGFVYREEGRLYAGPYLAAIDAIQADERAKEAVRNFVLRRYLRRRLDEVEPDASD